MEWQEIKKEAMDLAMTKALHKVKARWEFNGAWKRSEKILRLLPSITVLWDSEGSFGVSLSWMRANLRITRWSRRAEAKDLVKNGKEHILNITAEKEEPWQANSEDLVSPQEPYP